jgi:hypothetical protein
VSPFHFTKLRRRLLRKSNSLPFTRTTLQSSKELLKPKELLSLLENKSKTLNLKELRSQTRNRSLPQKLENFQLLPPRPEQELNGLTEPW